jgi:hypothetical protein
MSSVFGQQLPLLLQWAHRHLVHLCSFSPRLCDEILKNKKERHSKLSFQHK